ncbi:uncharacterized protein LOC123293463 [Chrysoperla carnea]|uniref:uncharacterized protein LOC123293463 n=1 Tax=Chrysoperla carnea TaxID=189513 RepID=UPI001D07F505|nr:uncharacterized protein LOC123293463 [Chrysoperla carnea]
MAENDALNHKVFTQQFIDLYETLPELWNPKNLAYIDKNKRNQALDKLLTICKKVNKNANREDVRKKINTLRSNYKKEMNKIIASKSSGAGPEDVYKPTSWTFYALKFLQNAETSDSDYSNEKESSIEIKNETDVSDPQILVLPFQGQSNRKRSSIAPPTQQPPAKKKGRVVEEAKKQNEVLVTVCTEKQIPVIAMAWGEKLKNLDPQQRVFAEKAVNDVLFEASMGTLNRYSVKINEDRPPDPLSSSSFHAASTSNSSIPIINTQHSTFHESNQSSSDSETSLHKYLINHEN